MGQFILNGRNYSGLTYARGVFIDTDNVIKSITAFRDSMSYTATEDCFIGIYLVGTAGSDVAIRINNKWVTAYYYNATLGDGLGYPLKKGQTISISGATSQYDSSYVVYGIQEGSPVTFLSEYASACYDTNEREVGCWINGKPLYKRTWDFSASPLIIPYNDWVDTGIPVSVNIEKIISAESQYGSLANMGIEIATGAGGFVVGANKYDNTGNTRGLAYLTLLYTKTTDVAGSGKLTPTAMPTVHYSTSEQVIGTWIDGKPIYQCTWTGTKTTNAEEVVISGLVTLDTLVDSKVIFKGNTGAQIAQYFRDASDFGRCWFDNNGIHMDLGNSYPIRPVTWYITLQYTKTAD